MDKNNLSIIRQQLAQCVFNHKIQELASDRLDAMQNKIKWINITLMAVVIVFLILQIKYPKNFLFGSISIALTVFGILFLYFQKEFSIENRTKEHKKIALQYLGLRDKYKNFIADIMNNLESEKIISKRDLLQDQYQIINNLSLQTTYIDYEKTQIDLLGKTKKNEQFTWSDEEINRFLPKNLHI